MADRQYDFRFGVLTHTQSIHHVADRQYDFRFGVLTHTEFPQRGRHTVRLPVRCPLTHTEYPTRGRQAVRLPVWCPHTHTEYPPRGRQAVRLPVRCPHTHTEYPQRGRHFLLGVLSHTQSIHHVADRQYNFRLGEDRRQQCCPHLSVWLLPELGLSVTLCVNTTLTGSKNSA